MAGETIECPECLGRLTIPKPEAPKKLKKKKPKAAKITGPVSSSSSQSISRPTIYKKSSSQKMVLRSEQEPETASSAYHAPVRRRRKKKVNMVQVIVAALGAALIIGGVFCPILSVQLSDRSPRPPIQPGAPEPPPAMQVTIKGSYLLPPTIKSPSMSEEQMKAQMKAAMQGGGDPMRKAMSFLHNILIPGKIGHLYFIVFPAIIAVICAAKGRGIFIWACLAVIFLKLVDDMFYITSLGDQVIGMMGPVAAMVGFKLSLAWGWALLFIGFMVLLIAFFFEMVSR